MKLWGTGGTVGLGSGTRAAAVCHCCGGERGGRLILRTDRKKRAGSLQCSEEHFFAHLRQWLSRCCSSEGGHSAAPCWLSHGLGRAAGIGAMQCLRCPGAWCGPWTAGGEEQGGSRAGGLCPASLLLKGRAVAVGVATAGCSPWGPALISALHCFC